MEREFDTLSSAPSRLPPVRSGGEMRARIEAFDWSATPLGPMAAWPQSLKTALSICLGSRFPMMLWWGPDLINLYNDAYIDVLGQWHPDALGKLGRDLWRETWPVIGPQVEEVMERGGSSFNDRVHLVYTRHGYPEDTWYTWSFGPIRDESGRVGGLFNTCHDETQRVLAEQDRERLLTELDNQRSRLASVVEQAPAFICTLRGPDHVFEVANEQYFQMADRRDILGRTVRDVQPEVEGQGYLAILDRVYRTGEPHHATEMPLRLRRGDGTLGEPRFINVSWQALREADDSVSGVFVHGVDVTDVVRAREAVNAANAELEVQVRERTAALAEAERANRLKDEFLATLSHELRTPLTATLLWSRLLRTGAVRSEEEKTQALEAIEVSADAQKQLIDDLLDVARMTSGKLALSLREVELEGVVQAAVEAVRPLAEAKGVEVELAFGSQVGPAQADPDRVRQVVWNVLNNAVKFTDPGGEVRVRLRRLADDRAQVQVQDTGRGIAPDFLPHVFERFRQQDGSSTRAVGGLGLGLSIARQIVELHGGTIRAESDGLGKGATFTVELPLPAAAPPDRAASSRAVAATVRPESERPQCLRGVRALIVEDDPVTCSAMVWLLKHQDADVTAVGSAAAAVAAFREGLNGQRYDVVLSDIGLPERDGYDLLRELRAIEAQAGRAEAVTPVIAITAYVRPEDREQVLQAGFRAHLAKPVEPAVLVAEVAAAIGQAGGRRDCRVETPLETAGKRPGPTDAPSTSIRRLAAGSDSGWRSRGRSSSCTAARPAPRATARAKGRASPSSFHNERRRPGAASGRRPRGPSPFKRHGARGSSTCSSATSACPGTTSTN